MLVCLAGIGLNGVPGLEQCVGDTAELLFVVGCRTAGELVCLIVMGVTAGVVTLLLVQAG